MKTNLPDFCDDKFLIESSEEETEKDCLKHCKTVGDPGDTIFRINFEQKSKNFLSKNFFK